MKKFYFGALGLLVGAIIAVGCHKYLSNRPSSPHSSIPGVPQPTADQDGMAADPRISVAAMDRRVPVIMYHDVVKERDASSVWFDATESEFRAQMQLIKDQGFTPISLDDFYAHLTVGKSIPEHSIVLTFDDNYEGVYTYAFPILKEFNYPFAVFVHTNFVGDHKTAHPKMSWDELKDLLSSGLATIGSHTQSHPEDMSQLSEADQRKEIAGSIEILHRHLEIPINYFAYPNGKYDAITEGICKDSGLKIAFAMDHGLAEDSTNLYSIHRYEHLKLADAIQDSLTEAAEAPAAVPVQNWKVSPVRLQVGTYAGLTLAMVTGGSPSSILSNSRDEVATIVSQNGGVAGINGTFFAMAALTGTSNVLVGPSETSNVGTFSPESSPYLLKKLQNRPVIFWGPKRIAIVPFQGDTLNDEAPYKDFMPDMTDLFVGGAWVIHAGIPRSNEDMMVYGSQDLKDPRRRAIFGWNAQGEPVLCASLQTCTTERIAQAAAEAGLQEAVLLDSGFSTSLVFNGDQIVTGHTAKNLASRPVPHIIMLKGDVDMTGSMEAEKAAASGKIDPADLGATTHRTKRRTKVKVIDPSVGTGDAGQPGDPNLPVDPGSSKDSNSTSTDDGSVPPDSSGGSSTEPPKKKGKG